VTPAHAGSKRSTVQLFPARPDLVSRRVGIDDEELAVMLVSLYASDMDANMPVADPIETERLCKEAILQRMMQGEFRRYIARLVRNIYLSDRALDSGLGIEEALEFWQWFDRRMWPSPSSWDCQGVKAAGS
jgi:hypothetical protein